jgi:hypothetical protein
MASSQEQKAFIAEIAPCAQKAYKELGKVYPSICIAMACVESAYGTSKIMRKHNAFLGHKVGSGKTALKYWDGLSFNAKTKEEYTVGTHTVIRDNFRKFKDMEQCVFNFYELLNSGAYKKVLANVDYATQMKQIKECGYMTSSTEVNTVLSIISRYDLTKYDAGESAQVPLHIQKRRLLKKTLPFMQGSDVVHCQRILRELGYDIGSYGIDGKYGSATETAVKKFQDEHGLVVDGKVGVKTWAMLEKYNEN